MNAIKRYASDDAHVIFGTAYDKALGDQFRERGVNPLKAPLLLML